MFVERGQHYFLTYKDMPGTIGARVEMAGVYGAEMAREVIRRSQEDYREKFGDLQGALDDALTAFDEHGG